MRRKAKQTDQRNSAKTTKRFLILFGSIFMLAGLAMLKPLLITPLQKTHDAKTWTPTSATVVSSNVEEHHSDDGTTYSVYISYRYTMDGKEFTGDNYTFTDISSSGYESKAAVVRQYPKNTTIDIFVNPSDPSESVVLRDLSAEILLIGLFPIVFTAVGCGIVALGFHKKKLNTAQAKEQIIELKGRSPIWKVIGILLFTTIWLTAVFFLFKVGAPIFMASIFGFFGLITIGMSIHAILSLANPLPIVEMSPGDIRPGTSVSLRWRMNGNPERINRFSAHIQCLEVKTVTHRSGGKTTTRIVKEPIYEERILDTDDMAEIAQGILQFKIPFEAKASDPISDPQIEWQLNFHGDIARWPDIKESFPIVVYPEDFQVV